LLTVPIKAIDLGHVGLWRRRLRSEIHYLSSQGEWLVRDGNPHKMIDKWRCFPSSHRREVFSA
jgi:hypothetical protein